ncbi:hypothetical protein CYMTET_32442, partial [Cymbomonas tetramitiformis]
MLRGGAGGGVALVQVPVMQVLDVDVAANLVLSMGDIQEAGGILSGMALVPGSNLIERLERKDPMSKDIIVSALVCRVEVKDDLLRDPVELFETMNTEQLVADLPLMNWANMVEIVEKSDVEARVSALCIATYKLAAGILCDMSEDAAIKTLTAIPAKIQSQILVAMPTDRAAKMLRGIPDIARVLDCLGEMSLTQLAQMVAAMEPLYAATLMDNLSPQAVASALTSQDSRHRARILQLLEPTMAVSVMRWWPKEAVAEAYALMDRRRGQALKQMSMQEEAVTSVKNLAGTDVCAAGKALMGLDASKGGMALSALEVKQALQIIPLIECQQMAGFLGHMELKPAKDIHDVLHEEMQVEFLKRMPFKPAMNLLKLYPPEKQCNMISRICTSTTTDSVVAGSEFLLKLDFGTRNKLLHDMKPEVAANALAGMKPEAAVSVMQDIAHDKLGPIMGAMDEHSIARVLEAMPPGQVLNSMLGLLRAETSDEWVDTVERARDLLNHLEQSALKMRVPERNLISPMMEDESINAALHFMLKRPNCAALVSALEKLDATLVVETSSIESAKDEITSLMSLVFKRASEQWSNKSWARNMHNALQKLEAAVGGTMLSSFYLNSAFRE